MFKWIKSRATMKRTGFAFTDIVSGKPVYYYKDCYKQEWMANSKWSIFRCDKTNQ